MMKQASILHKTHQCERYLNLLPRKENISEKKEIFQNVSYWMQLVFQTSFLYPSFANAKDLG